MFKEPYDLWRLQFELRNWCKSMALSSQSTEAGPPPIFDGLLQGMPQIYIHVIFALHGDVLFSGSALT